jgi:predicted dehydrogenase
MNMLNRRNFIKNSAIAGTGVALNRSFLTNCLSADGVRVGIIGLDTSHCTAFTEMLNDPSSGDTFFGFRVVAAYPHGSLDIKSSYERIAGYTEEVKKMGVEIVDSIDTLLKKADVILLETNDGRRHLEQAIPVLKAGKRLFIDKPMTASLADAMIIFDAALHFSVPVFSTSGLRYIKGMDKIKNGSVGKVLGAETFSPAYIEKTHPDLFWYGIHGVEALFTAMGTGCKTVVRVSTADTDVVTGTWEDGRIGSFRGLRAGKKDYGGVVYGENDIMILGPDNGYKPLLGEIAKYFQSGIIPVKPEETLEILAFMEGADVSKKRGGIPVELTEIMDSARKESINYQF